MNKKFLVLLVFAPLVLAGCVTTTGEPAETGEVCTAKTGESMTVEEARQIALASECGEQGDLKETYVCNEDTATLWLDLDAEKEYCPNPACVVNLATKKAEINWRCMGVPPPQ